MGCGRQSQRLKTDGLVGKGAQGAVGVRAGGVERHSCPADVEVVTRASTTWRLLVQTLSSACSIVVVAAVQASVVPALICLLRG